MRATTLLALVCFALVIELVLARQSSSYEWVKYKRQHGKVYDDQAEDARRFSLFLAAKERVERHNANESNSHKLGLNHFSDWTRKERGQLSGLHFDGLAHQKNHSIGDRSLIGSLLDSSVETPDELDWRKSPNRVGPVRDQSHCTSPYAFAAIGVLEGQQVLRNFSKTLVQLSAQEIVDCSIHNYHCNGGSVSAALNDLHLLGGIVKEEDYPYKALPLVCEFDSKRVLMTLAGPLDFLAMDETLLEQLVAAYGPVAAYLEVNDRTFDYSSGVFDDTQCTGDALNHVALIVGYGNDPKQGKYWILKNSWGPKWGEDGYLRIRRGSGRCGLGKASTIAKF